MQQVENSLLVPKPNRAVFNLDSETKTTTTFGQLTPVFFRATVPGGYYDLTNETLCRFEPLVSPLMHRCEVKTMYFHVPYRILWDNWENFIMGKKDPLTELDPVCPFFRRDYMTSPNNTTTGLIEPKLANYFGHRAQETGAPWELELYNPFAFSAYQAIYNRYFRHSLLREEVPYKLNDGDITDPYFQEIAKMRQITHVDDYFNSALPSPQLGGAAFIDDNSPILLNSETVNNVTLQGDTLDPFINDNFVGDTDRVAAETLYAQVQINMEEIRRVAAAQKFVENERHTRRYVDWLKLNFDVDYPDGRIDEPLYITGGSYPVIVSDVMNTADDNQGRITGNASGYSRGNRGGFYAYEHGLIMGIAVVTYKPQYITAIPREHFKVGRFEFFHTAFDGIGEQAIYRGELCSKTEKPRETFGYVPRHWDYRASFDMCTGLMSTVYAHWHLARNISLTPQLTEDFYEVLDDRRIFQFQDPEYDPIKLQVYTDVRAQLPMQKVPQPII